MVIDIEAENIHEGMDMDNEIFKMYDGGDYYYPYCEFVFNLDLFKPTTRKLDKRPVWLFIGESNIGKSYLASMISENNDKKIYETDTNKELPSEIIEDIIVKGNKYDFNIEDIENRIFGEHELILVNFQKFQLK